MKRLSSLYQFLIDKIVEYLYLILEAEIINVLNR